MAGIGKTTIKGRPPLMTRAELEAPKPKEVTNPDKSEFEAAKRPPTIDPHSDPRPHRSLIYGRWVEAADGSRVLKIFDLLKEPESSKTIPEGDIFYAHEPRPEVPEPPAVVIDPKYEALLAQAKTAVVQNPSEIVVRDVLDNPKVIASGFVNQAQVAFLQNKHSMPDGDYLVADGEMIFIFVRTEKRDGSDVRIISFYQNNTLIQDLRKLNLTQLFEEAIKLEDN